MTDFLGMTRASIIAKATKEGMAVSEAAELAELSFIKTIKATEVQKKRFDELMDKFVNLSNYQGPG